jgi:hypothetical protein
VHQLVVHLVHQDLVEVVVGETLAAVAKAATAKRKNLR